MQNKLFAVLLKHIREIRSRHPGEGSEKRKQTDSPENLELLFICWPFTQVDKIFYITNIHLFDQNDAAFHFSLSRTCGINPGESDTRESPPPHKIKCPRGGF